MLRWPQRLIKCGRGGGGDGVGAGGGVGGGVEGGEVERGGGGGGEAAVGEVTCSHLSTTFSKGACLMCS